MFRRSLIVLLVAFMAGSAAAQADRVDCRKLPDHPDCAARG